MHGTKPEMTQDFIEASAATKPIAMLCEGTNLVGADYSTEQEVNVKIGKVVSQSQNLVLAAFRNTDIDRTRTLYDVVRRNHRKLAISLRQAYVLNKLKTDKNLEFPPIDSADFLIFKHEKKDLLQMGAGHSRLQQCCRCPRGQEDSRQSNPCHRLRRLEGTT